MKKIYPYRKKRARETKRARRLKNLNRKCIYKRKKQIKSIAGMSSSVKYGSPSFQDKYVHCNIRYSPLNDKHSYFTHE